MDYFLNCSHLLLHDQPLWHLGRSSFTMYMSAVLPSIFQFLHDTGIGQSFFPVPVIKIWSRMQWEQGKMNSGLAHMTREGGRPFTKSFLTRRECTFLSPGGEGLRVKDMLAFH